MTARRSESSGLVCHQDPGALACTDVDEVGRFFDAIEAEVKPQVQPFYATNEPDGTP